MGLLWVTLGSGAPLLFEEPGLSLHPEIVRMLPQLLARVQRRTGHQIFISTHSPELLQDSSIGLDDVMLLTPGAEGTDVAAASSQRDIKPLLEGGAPLSDIVIPRARPINAAQLPLFGDTAR